MKKVMGVVAGVIALAAVIVLASLVYEVLREGEEVQLLSQPAQTEERPAQSGVAAPGIGTIDTTQSLIDASQSNIEAALEMTEPHIPTQKTIQITEDAPADDRVAAFDFTMQDAQGNTVALSDYIGKPIVLNFWASWCPPCKTEMPDFERVFLEMSGEVHFLMVNLPDGQRETVETAKAYITQEGFTFPVYFDTEQEGAFAYNIRSIPTTLFICREGFIVTGAQGAISESTLRKGIELIV
jgi:thiol-disulfide isomerase/thioredoxin